MAIVKWEKLTTKMAPYDSGVYALYVRKESGRKKILYIGSSWCLRNRISNNKIRRELRVEYPGLKVQYIITKDYLALEEQLILSIRPPRNKQYLLPPVRKTKSLCQIV